MPTSASSYQPSLFQSSVSWAGIKHIVMCRENQKNVEEIPEKYLKGVDFHYVENVADVWQFALTDEKVKNPTDFSIEENDKKE